MKKVIGFLASMSFAAISSAQLYVDGNIGSVDATGNLVSGQESSYGLGIGYQFSPFFAVDVHHQQVGNGNGIKVNATMVRAIGILPINPVFSLNVKLAAGNTKLTSGFNTAQGSGSVGVGGSFAISNRFSMGLDVDRYKVSQNFGESRFLTTTVSGKYSF